MKRQNLANERNLGLKLLELAHLPVNGHTKTIGDDFMVADNIESSERLPDFVFGPGSEVQLCTPVKIRFSLMLLCLGGSMKLRLGMREYTLMRGNMLMSVSGMVGECLEISHDAKLAMVAISDSFIDSNVSPEEGVLFRENFVRMPFVNVAEHDFEYLETVYMILRNKLAEPGFNLKKQMVYVSLGLILCCAFGHISVADVHVNRAKNRKEQIFDEFIKLVEKHCSQRHDVSFYADKLCITPKYLSTTVLEVSGKYASEWIRDHVVFEAKALLNSHRYTIQQISEQLGFANQSHFGVYFKRVAGCSPKAYMSGGIRMHESGG